MADTTYRLQLKDGRQLAYAVYGVPLDAVEPPSSTVLYHHGWPCCRVEGAMWQEAASAQRVRFIAVDRPGVGLSTYHSKMTFRSFVGDIEQLLDHLNIQKVVFIGVSGGGPYACACARFLPDRTAALGLVAGMTHCAGPGSASLTRNQHWTNRFGMTAVAWAPAAVGASLAVVRPLARIAPGVVGWWLSKFGRVGPARAAVTWVATTGFSMADYRALVKRPSGILPLLWVVSGAFETGWRGVLHDMWITINPWDFSISDIPASIPTQIFQGAEDVCVTVDMAQHLKQGIPQAKLTVFPGEGHLSIVMYQASLMLQAMVAAASR